MIARLFEPRLMLPAYLALCVVLGGSSSGGAVANALLQLLGLAILWFAATQERAVPVAGDIPGRYFKWLILATCGWIVVQFVPLPSGLWSAIPGRANVAQGMELLGNEPGWRPLAIEWERAIASALSFIPPFAVLAMALRAEPDTITRGILAILAATVLAAVVGVAQIAAGDGSPLYFYDITSVASSVGFFANSNHFATLFIVCAALAIVGIEPDRTGRGGGSFAWLAWLAFTGFLLANVFLNRSLAGLALGMMVAAYCATFFIARLGSPAMRWGGIGIIALGGLAAMMFAVFAPRSLTEKLFVQTTDVGSRTYIWDGTYQAIVDTFPYGIGLGNFRWFYPQYEDPNVILSVYINHAHNDWLEFILEGGIFAVAILGLLGMVLARSARRHLRGNLTQIVRRAAPYVVLLVIALHSLVDYPLRTATIAAVGTLALVMAMRGLTFEPDRLLRGERIRG
ncbi:O-antigen ligase family protein [Qipengyuania sp. JC766]|uniref:O-antigen ligase family protein n=1 Tax=Qipengyuania sp. JC766 TaxID=3232139 RepID=UPI00345B3F85